MKYLLCSLLLFCVLGHGLSAQTNPKKVRVIYLIPTDRELNPLYKSSIKEAILNVQHWYEEKLGFTFTLNPPVVEVLHSKHDAAYYNSTQSSMWGDNKKYWFNANAIEDCKEKLGLTMGDDKYVWVIYVDAHGETGAGGNSVCSLPEHDILGVSGLHKTETNVQRWYGGLAHEIGHAFGLAHPGDTEANALMQYGYAKYPDCYLTDADVEILTSNSFLNPTQNDLREYYEKYTYNGGAFINYDEQWEEHTTGKVFYFTETSRDGQYIYLFDKTRKFYIKLPVEGGLSYIMPEEEEWRALYEVTPEE